MIATCVRSGKCRWRTIPLGDDFDLATDLATSHSIAAHADEYMWFVPRDSVPVLSMPEKIELSFYTDFSGESIL